MKTLIAAIFLLTGLNSYGQHGPGDTTATEEVEKHNILLFAPNTFTPDGDYYNDSWGIFIEGNDSYDFHLTIFDRTGHIVWESYNSSGEWDGNYGGNEAPDGIYVWVIQTKDAQTDKIHEFKGHLMLLR